MDQKAIIHDLYKLPDLLKKEEAKFLAATSSLLEAKHNLFAKQCELLGSGKIKGKNEAARDAEMWPLTKDLYKEILKAENELDKSKLSYYYTKRLFENVQLAAKILSS